MEAELYREMSERRAWLVRRLRVEPDPLAEFMECQLAGWLTRFPARPPAPVPLPLPAGTLEGYEHLEQGE